MDIRTEWVSKWYSKRLQPPDKVSSLKARMPAKEHYGIQPVTRASKKGDKRMNCHETCHPGQQEQEQKQRGQCSKSPRKARRAQQNGRPPNKSPRKPTSASTRTARCRGNHLSKHNCEHKKCTLLIKTPQQARSRGQKHDSCQQFTSERKAKVLSSNASSFASALYIIATVCGRYSCLCL